MNKADWIWMPHPAHFICANDCRFHLATWVGKYIVSTVGEYFPDSEIREIFASSRRVVLKGQGDERKRDYMEKVGYEEIGYGRKYETMVFTAKKNDDPEGCCPYLVAEHAELTLSAYNSAPDAYKGHLQLCDEWSQK